MTRRDHTHTEAEASPSAGWRGVYAEMECSTDIEDHTQPPEDLPDVQRRVRVYAPSFVRVAASITGICMVVMLL